eukprot:gnl/MRDRNA2_/MRDRNA2_36557_c0_seq1.p1 gnl/MRDRNA2_/MRDRNA2_36557_c0~~gnl/MRDRNA2_/MRDRNA2_36557_c0_seq1.p1  ORF type:complete len:477 (+),score=82.69 gnl/MRDRNA2_/MRDRNA2_36557_c0_seq1:117-1547(+)
MTHLPVKGVDARDAMNHTHVTLLPAQEKPFSSPTKEVPGATVKQYSAVIDEGLDGLDDMSCNYVAILRAAAITLVAWLATGILILSGTELMPHPFGLAYAEILAIFLVAVGVYVNELRSCRLWNVVMADAGSEDFVEALSDFCNAAPMVEFVVPGMPPVGHPISEWLDETRKVEHCRELPRGLFLVSMPLEFVPGDADEAAALEYQRVRVCEDAVDTQTDDACLTGRVEIRLRLRHADGTETSEPAPRLLASGPGGAAPLWLRPLTVTVCSACLLGLVAEGALCCSLQRLSWPIRKRFFTVRGAGQAGMVRFNLNLVPRGGETSLEGIESELRSAHSFWLRDTDWDMLWAEASSLAADLSWLRRCRRAVCFASLMVAAIAVAVLVADVSMRSDAVCSSEWTLATALTVFLWVIAGIVGCCSSQRSQSSVRWLAKGLPGADINTTWSDGGDSLVLTAERRRKPGGTEGPALLTTAKR